jgi:hypothetical protein
MNNYQQGIDNGLRVREMSHGVQIYCRSYSWSNEINNEAAFIRAASQVSTWFTSKNKTL